MSLTNNLLYLILLFRLTTTLPINLYYTEWTNGNAHPLQHNCLRMGLQIMNDGEQIIHFCMSESSSIFDVERNNSFQKFTFADLAKTNITSQQLYSWSAPIDTIENYQFYLNQLSTSNDDSSLSMKVFYNCTLPRFGPFCQYQLHYHSFSNDLINEFYQMNMYNPKDLTCYEHLQCHRGPSPSCLDWSEICDGKIDCLDGGFDEEYCWQLEMNECEENEYRCRNGRCIPQSFVNDRLIGYDCLDGSDEYHTMACSTNRRIQHFFPSYICEDVTCTSSPFTSSCVAEREDLLMKSSYSNKNSFPSEICRSALLCIIDFPYIDRSHCNIFCMDNACSEIIQNNCSDVLYFSIVPLLFGDIYFAHTKDDLQLIICYNVSYYDAYFIHMSKIFINNMTCIHSASTHQQSEADEMYRENVEHLYKNLQKYHLSYRYRSEFCRRSNMYQCLNSSKCISIFRLLDTIDDCPYRDDENLTAIYHGNPSESIMKNYFFCSMADKYVRRSLVHNGICDCHVPFTSWCEDEEVHVSDDSKNFIVLFQYICDGFIDFNAQLIDGRNETDETECEKWECDNIYTHCDDVWNCPNGADELHCQSWRQEANNCSSQEHTCISQRTNEFICLPVEKASDGHVDCLGAIDELDLCGKHIQTMDADQYPGFHCTHQGSSLCIDKTKLCDGIKQCDNADDERFCSMNRTTDQGVYFCATVLWTLDMIVEEFLCQYHAYLRSSPRVDFRLHETTEIDINPVLPTSADLRLSNSLKFRCHRGLDLDVWLNNTVQPTTSTCLCPPSFYGSQCQYQNQRISLTVQFQAFFNSWQTLFAIVVSLIDDGEKGIIHSYEQISFLPAKHCQTKFHLYLLYSTRPKDASKNYFIQIDFYEKNSFTYRGSRLISVQFSFLPVHRLAYLVDIPRTSHSIPDCLDDRCVHGHCIGYLNQASTRTFCRCDRGWSGRYCTVPYNDTCSSDSLYLGRLANERSICLCGENRFGPRCLLTYEPFSSICENNGTYIPLNVDLDPTNNFLCICPKGFTGDQCEQIENKFIFFFSEHIITQQSIFIHFIDIIGHFERSLARTSTFRTLPVKQD